MPFYGLEYYLVCPEIHHNICNYDVWMIYDFSCLTKNRKNHTFEFFIQNVSYEYLTVNESVR